MSSEQPNQTSPTKQEELNASPKLPAADEVKNTNEPTDIEVPINESTQTDQQQGDATVADGETTSPNYCYGIFKRHMRFDPLSIVFAILILVGGIVGYVTKGSAASLVAGTVFAILLAVSTYIEGARR